MTHHGNTTPSVLAALLFAALAVYGSVTLIRRICDEDRPAKIELQGPPQIERARPGDGVDWETNDQAFAWIAHKYKKSSTPEPWTGRTTRDKRS